MVEQMLSIVGAVVITTLLAVIGAIIIVPIRCQYLHEYLRDIVFGALCWIALAVYWGERL